MPSILHPTKATLFIFLLPSLCPRHPPLSPGWKRNDPPTLNRMQPPDLCLQSVLPCWCLPRPLSHRLLINQVTVPTSFALEIDYCIQPFLLPVAPSNSASPSPSVSSPFLTLPSRTASYLLLVLGNTGPCIIQLLLLVPLCSLKWSCTQWGANMKTFYFYSCITLNSVLLTHLFVPSDRTLWHIYFQLLKSGPI